MTFRQLVERAVLREKEKGPKFDTLKKNKVKLTDEERKEVMDRGATWHHGPNGEETPAVQKAVVKGKTWYWCATHRAGQVKPTLKGAIRAYDFIKTTASLKRGPSIGG